MVIGFRIRVGTVAGFAIAHYSGHKSKRVYVMEILFDMIYDV